MSDNSIDRLLAIMEQLRDPDGGCPWDRKQSYQSIIPYTLEEAYEVADAIDREDFDDLKGELGDLLFQVVFYCQIAKEENRFDFDAVAAAMVEKLIRRHPHVFADHTYEDEATFKRTWEQTKQQERSEKAQASGEQEQESILDDLPAALPALQKALKVQKRVAAYGFDWQQVSEVWDKIEEESAEVKAAIAAQDGVAIMDEIGDMLFCLVNLSRHLKVNPEVALRHANEKFTRRFKALEAEFRARDEPLEKASLAAMEAVWCQVKKKESM